ncbi:hypothetical protein ACA365_22435, partial [Enterobacter roggenkampii]|uniref:hypothetical protein n=1 Tax=Enterobacter roggenkampii TaxID=1812935 RepID=UPI003B9DDB01
LTSVFNPVGRFRLRLTVLILVKPSTSFENPRVLGSIPSPGTNIHKASLQSGAFSFSGYGRFLVVATRYLFAGFLAIFADVRYF